jgi:threonine/homoserine/homoserine lactone efflux protein
MDLLTVLPLAIVMSAGPQIITAVFLATSRDARRNSLAFLGAVAAATTIGVTVFYLLGNAVSGDDSEDSGRNWLDYLIVALLVFLAVRVYMKRKTTEPPKWMGRLEAADPRFSAKIGFLLYLLMPTDVVSMATVGAYLAREGAPWAHGLPVHRPHRPDRGSTADHAPAAGEAGRDGVAEGQKLDERELLDRQRGRDPLLPRDGPLRLS